MGLSSFLTSDTKESIAIDGSGHLNESRPSYLLQPNGLEPIEEDDYQGHCVFGGINCYEWLARINLSTDELRYFGIENIYDAGCALGIGDYYEDKDDGTRYSYHYNHIHPSLIGFGGNFSTPMEKYCGRSPNELIADGTFIVKPIRELFDFRYPLKFSFNPNAVYEDLPEAESCPHQGWFYDDNDDYDLQD